MVWWGCDAVRQLAHISGVWLSGGTARAMYKEDTRSRSGPNLVIHGSKPWCVCDSSSMEVAIARRMSTNGGKLGDGQHGMRSPLPGKIYFLF